MAKVEIDMSIDLGEAVKNIKAFAEGIKAADAAQRSLNSSAGAYRGPGGGGGGGRGFGSGGGAGGGSSGDPNIDRILNRDRQGRNRVALQEQRREQSEQQQLQTQAARRAANDIRAANRVQLQAEKDAADEQERFRRSLDSAGKANFQRRLKERQQAERQDEDAGRQQYERRFKAAKQTALQAAQGQQELDRSVAGILERDRKMSNRVARQTEEEAKKRSEKQVTAESQLRQKTLNLLNVGGFAGQVGTYQTYGQALSDAGYTRAGGAVSRAAPVIAAATEGEKIARSATLLNNDPFLTGKQRSERLLQGLPVFGWIANRARDYTGLTSRLEQEREIEGPSRLLRAGGEAELSGMRFAGGRAATDAARTASSLQGYGAVGLPTADRSTALGRRQYEEQLRAQPALQQLELAERRLTAARLMRTDATARAAKAERELNAERGLFNAEKAKVDSGKAGGVTGGGSDDFRQAVDSGAGGARQITIAQKQRELDEARSDFQKYDSDLVGRTRERDMAKVRYSQAQLGSAEVRRDVAEGTAERLGGMGRLGRLQARQAFELVMRVGIDNVPADQASLAETYAPQKMAELKRAAGERSPEADYLRRVSPADAPGRIADLESEVSRRRGEVVGGEAAAERAFAVGLGKVMGDAYARIITEVKAIVNARIDQEIEALKQESIRGRALSSPR